MNPERGAKPAKSIKLGRTSLSLGSRARAGLTKFARSESGTAVVLMALSLVALLGFTALVTDVGLLFLNHSRIANAVDSGVLAGAQELPAYPSAAVETARAYALANGTEESEAQFSVSEANNEITGEITREVPFYFARILGLTQGQVKARAKARVGPLSSATGCVPLGVIKDDFRVGQEYTLKEGAGGSQHKGWFKCLRLGGCGASVYNNNLKYGYDGELKIGDVIACEPGNMSGPTREGITYRLNACPHTPQCSGESYVKTCPRVLLVPVVEVQRTTPGGAVKSVRVVGFAAFLVDEPPGCGNENEVTGHFIEATFSGTVGTGIAEYGAYGVQLIE